MIAIQLRKSIKETFGLCKSFTTITHTAEGGGRRRGSSVEGRWSMNRKHLYSISIQMQNNNNKLDM